MLSTFENFHRVTAIAQTADNEALIACAIERYRLANGKLPENLEMLVPKYLEKLPLDVCNGEPLIYRPGKGRDFDLYSVGWNLKDDGGVTIQDSKNSRMANPKQGDWVWPKYGEE